MRTFLGVIGNAIVWRCCISAVTGRDEERCSSVCAPNILVVITDFEDNFFHSLPEHARTSLAIRLKHLPEGLIALCGSADMTYSWLQLPEGCDHTLRVIGIVDIVQETDSTSRVGRELPVVSQP